MPAALRADRRSADAAIRALLLVRSYSSLPPRLELNRPIILDNVAINPTPVPRSGALSPDVPGMHLRPPNLKRRFSGLMLLAHRRSRSGGRRSPTCGSTKSCSRVSRTVDDAGGSSAPGSRRIARTSAGRVGCLNAGRLGSAWRRSLGGPPSRRARETPARRGAGRGRCPPSRRHGGWAAARGRPEGDRSRPRCVR